MTTQIALSNDFLRALDRLPKTQRKKVREFMEKFRRDPSHVGIHYESLEGACDPKVRSVRIDQTYRAIVVKPPAGDVYLCVWVDHHDEAYQWVKDKRFEVNPRTGGFQVYSMQESQALGELRAASSGAGAIPDGRLFAGFDDDDLLLLGVPEPLLPSVRVLRDDHDLLELLAHLPEDAQDALVALAAGEQLDKLFEELEVDRGAAARFGRRRAEEPVAEVDVDDFAASLERPDSQRKFKVVEGERELMEMLNAPMEQWRIFLHPSQRKIVRWNVKAPMKLTGGAGTGKTVALMHRAKYLTREVFKDSDDRVLLVTFTRNLAQDIKAQTRKLFGDGEGFDRLEITNLHAWARRFMSAQGITFDVVMPETSRRLWDDACTLDELGLDVLFYRDEWEKVVQAEGLVERAQYARASRRGRGTRLGRQQRNSVWKVFEAYRRNLEKAGKVEYTDIVREALLTLEKHTDLLPYRAVLVDEAQDLKTIDLKLVRAMVPREANDLTIAGDAHQRIYGHQASLGQCGIEVRGRSRRLKLNYRTTGEIRDWAVAVLEGVTVDDLDDDVDTLQGYRSLRTGPLPKVAIFKNESEEADAIVAQLRDWLIREKPEDICLAVRTRKLLTSRYKPLLEQEGIPCVEIRKDADEALGPGVRLSTLHRLKGLEFPIVWLAGLNEGVMPLEQSQLPDDEGSREDHERSEKCLLYVAATRARDELVVSAYGSGSHWLL